MNWGKRCACGSPVVLIAAGATDALRPVLAACRLGLFGVALATAVGAVVAIERPTAMLSVVAGESTSATEGGVAMEQFQPIRTPTAPDSPDKPQLEPPGNHYACVTKARPGKREASVSS